MAEMLKVLETQQGVKLPHLRSNDLVELFPGYGFTEESHAIFDNVTAKEFLASNAVNALWVSNTYTIRLTPFDSSGFVHAGVFWCFQSQSLELFH